MVRLHIIGKKNHGKTTLIEELVSVLTRGGLSVGTIKHTHHHHELDVPGKDSYRHRTAGANVVGILSPLMNAVFMPAAADQAGGEDRYELLAPMFQSCELVLVEGNSSTAAPKLEVWRAEMGTRPYSDRDKAILAVVTDDELNTDATILQRSDVPSIAGWICEKILGRPRLTITPL